MVNRRMVLSVFILSPLWALKANRHVLLQDNNAFLFLTFCKVYLAVNNAYLFNTQGAPKPGLFKLPCEIKGGGGGGSNPTWSIRS